MNKVLQVIGNLLLSFILGLGGIIMLTALPLESAAGELFYWGLAIAAIPLLIWGRRLVGFLFRFIHSRWWSALVFWVGTTFVGLLPPYALIGWVVSVILASPRQPGHVIDNRSYSDDYLSPIHGTNLSSDFHDASPAFNDTSLATSDSSSFSFHDISPDFRDMSSDFGSHEINPSSGLPTLDGTASGLDVGGNLYGTNSAHNL